jgi:DnaJ-class molecular chaperone
MEFNKEKFRTFGILGKRQDRTQNIRNKRFVNVAPCVYCSGTGVDPKDGNKIICAVCGGKGEVKVTPPVVTCRKCSGTGKEGGDLTCLACRGIGVVTVRKEAATCSKCRGTGEDGVFYCTPCKGQGIV